MPSYISLPTLTLSLGLRASLGFGFSFGFWFGLYGRLIIVLIISRRIIIVLIISRRIIIVIIALVLDGLLRIWRRLSLGLCRFLLSKSRPEMKSLSSKIEKVRVFLRRNVAACVASRVAASAWCLPRSPSSTSIS